MYSVLQSHLGARAPACCRRLRGSAVSATVSHGLTPTAKCCRRFAAYWNPRAAARGLSWKSLFLRQCRGLGESGEAATTVGPWRRVCLAWLCGGWVWNWKRCARQSGDPLPPPPHQPLPVGENRIGPSQRRAMAPVPVDPCGTVGPGCAWLWAGGTPALPGSLHPIKSSHSAEASWWRLSLKEVHLSSCQFVFIRGSSSFNDRPYFLE